MEVQFNLPLTNDELLEFDKNNYYVKQSYTAAEIPGKLELCKQMLYQSDPFYIYDYFDIYYAVIEQKTIDSRSINNLLRAFDIMFITVNQLRINLAKFLTVNKPRDPHERIRYLNLTKMCLFLLINIVRKIEESNMIFKQREKRQIKEKQDQGRDGDRNKDQNQKKVNHKQQPPLIQQKQRQQQQQQQQQPKSQYEVEAEGKCCEKFADWASKRDKFLIQLYNVMQLPLEKLWQPSMIETNFINLLCNACYNILEKLHLSSNGPQVVNTIFQIFDLAIMRYHHAIYFPVCILRILRNVDNSGLYILFGFNMLLKKGHSIPTVFPILVKEILVSLSMDTGFSRMSRNYSRFLMELSYCAPQLFIPHLPTHCYNLLACKYNGIRSSILRMIGDVVVRYCSSKRVCDYKEKVLQYEYFGHLFMHIKDISYQVRAEVLQIWNCLKERNAVPLYLYTKVFAAAVERLADTIPSVRVHAMEMIVTFLENNPFNANITVNELKKRIHDELIKMDKLKEMALKQQKKAEQIEKDFPKIIPELMPHIHEIINSKEHESLHINMGYEELIQCIPKMLKKKEYREVVITVYKSDHGKPEIRHNMCFEAQCNYFLLLIKVYAFMGSDYKDNNKQLIKQIQIVQNLQYSLDFHQFLVQIMPKLIDTFSYKSLTNNIIDPLDLFKLESRIKQCLKAYTILNGNKDVANNATHTSNKRTGLKNGKNKAAFTSKKNKRNKNRKRL